MIVRDLPPNRQAIFDATSTLSSRSVMLNIMKNYVQLVELICSWKTIQLTLDMFYKQHQPVHQYGPPLVDYVHLVKQTINHYWLVNGKRSIDLDQY